MVSNRLSEQELENIWNKLLPGQNKVMSKIKFMRMFTNQDFTGSLKLTPAVVHKSFRTRFLQRTVSDYKSMRKAKSKLALIEPNLTDIHSKLKAYLRTSSKSLMDVFTAIDTDRIGTLTN